MTVSTRHFFCRDAPCASRHCCECGRHLWETEGDTCGKCLQGIQPGDPWDSSGSRIGASRRASYALAIFPLDIVHRSTIRALLPVGVVKDASSSRHLKRSVVDAGTGSKNQTSEQFRAALRTFERFGFIDRGREFIRVKDRGGLLDHALHGGFEPRCKEFLLVGAAVAKVSDEVDRLEAAMAAASLVGQRKRELNALRSMMQQPPISSSHRGAGQTRHRTGRDDHLEQGMHKRPKPRMGVGSTWAKS